MYVSYKPMGMLVKLIYIYIYIYIISKGREMSENTELNATNNFMTGEHQKGP
jgi:hypothetical protein